MQKYEKITASDPVRYDKCKSSHNCNFNYTCSSPWMETAGATNIFSLSKEKYWLYYITRIFMEMVTAKHMLLSKIYMVQVNLLRILNVPVTIKNVSVRGFLIWKKAKGLGGKGKLINTKIETTHNYFDIALGSNAGNLAAMKSACMASMYHICGYHDICAKSENTRCQYQKDKQDNTNYYKSKGDLLLLGEQFCLFINHFPSLRYWRNIFMTKPKTPASRLTR